ncbi:hypothetical protein AB0N21_41300 [Streptomyces sp. NPDC051080]|uniref:hypothetical protein n=1 Tax=Streptomyces sp. NPDC051080 TaxID=3157222 RepID=UPI003415456A
MPQSHPVSCVESGTRFQRRRLGGAEAAVIIVIIMLAAALVAFAGMPLAVVLQVLVGAGLTAVVVVGLCAGASGRWLRPLVQALLAPAA